MASCFMELRPTEPGIVGSGPTRITIFCSQCFLMADLSPDGEIACDDIATFAFNISCQSIRVCFPYALGSI